MLNNNPDIPFILRLPLSFNAGRLCEDLAKLEPQHWQAHFNAEIYEGDWSAAPLRAIPDSHNAIYSDPTASNWTDTELLNHCAYFQQALTRFECPLLSVRLLRLAPGAVIKEHRDYGLGLDVGEIRLHLVITTNPQVECRIDGHSYHWAAGECWYADFGLSHFFANRGDTERVHIVLDCKVNDWLLKQLSVASKSPAAVAIKSSEPASWLWLFEQTQHDADLRARLFASTDIESFLAIAFAYAKSLGHELNRNQLQDIMRQNHRRWIERQIL